jgi:hypothetical protein
VSKDGELVPSDASGFGMGIEEEWISPRGRSRPVGQRFAVL